MLRDRSSSGINQRGRVGRLSNVISVLAVMVNQIIASIHGGSDHEQDLENVTAADYAAGLLILRTKNTRIAIRVA